MSGSFYREVTRHAGCLISTPPNPGSFVVCSKALAARSFYWYMVWPQGFWQVTKREHASGKVMVERPSRYDFGRPLPTAKKTWSVNHEGPLKSGLDNADTTVTADVFPGYTQGQRLRIAVYTRSSTSSDVSLMFLAWAHWHELVHSWLDTKVDPHLPMKKCEFRSKMLVLLPLWLPL